MDEEPSKPYVPLAVLMLAGGAGGPAAWWPHIVHAGRRAPIGVDVRSGGDVARCCSRARARCIRGSSSWRRASSATSTSPSWPSAWRNPTRRNAPGGWRSACTWWRVEASRTLRRLGAERSSDFLFGIAHNLDLMAIEREGVRMGSQTLARLTEEELVRRINDPADPLGIREGDVLTFLGTENEVDAYLQTLLKEGLHRRGRCRQRIVRRVRGRAPDKLDLACVSLSVEAGSPFAGKTIGAVDFKGTPSAASSSHTSAEAAQDEAEPQHAPVPR